MQAYDCALRQIMISGHSCVKPTSGEPCLNREAEQILRVTRNSELTCGTSKPC
jgi:hypothetical protein